MSLSVITKLRLDILHRGLEPSGFDFTIFWNSEVWIYYIEV